MESKYMQLHTDFSILHKLKRTEKFENAMMQISLNLEYYQSVLLQKHEESCHNQEKTKSFNVLFLKMEYCFVQFVRPDKHFSMACAEFLKPLVDDRGFLITDLDHRLGIFGV